MTSYDFHKLAQDFPGVPRMERNRLRRTLVRGNDIWLVEKLGRR